MQLPFPAGAKKAPRRLEGLALISDMLWQVLLEHA